MRGLDRKVGPLIPVIQPRHSCALDVGGDISLFTYHLLGYGGDRRFYERRPGFLRRLIRDAVVPAFPLQ